MSQATPSFATGLPSSSRTAPAQDRFHRSVKTAGTEYDGEGSDHPDSSRGLSAETAAAQEAPHPDHHLWRNGRLFWVAFTIHIDGWRVERIRRSLGTTDIVEARRRRDGLLAEFESQSGVALSLRPPTARHWPQPRPLDKTLALGERLEPAPSAVHTSP